MKVEFQINNSVDVRARFLTWSPSPCRVRMIDPTGAIGLTVAVKVSSTSAAGGGQVRFAATAAGPFASTLSLTVPTSGASVNFFTAGVFDKASTNLGDIKIQATSGTTPIGSVDVMVRIRKNADKLTAGERDRFIAAFATLNNQGLGRFKDFRDMHTAASRPEAHGDSGFLPWHRAYLLDLERELQAIDPSVALPYWRFDQKAPNLFTTSFIGTSNSSGNVQFSPTNPLRFWTTDGVLGIIRTPLFNTSTGNAFVISETDTLNLGTSYVAFQDMEGDPHGDAHTSFSGSISSVPTAAKDPLFFLLHCNVDRLWAKWQKRNTRFNPATPQAYDNSPHRVGHNLSDTMWPWNGVVTPPRPNPAPGGSLAPSQCVTAPGTAPRVRDLLDYRGVVNLASNAGFDYDDVPN